MMNPMRSTVYIPSAPDQRRDISYFQEPLKFAIQDSSQHTHPSMRDAVDQGNLNKIKEEIFLGKKLNKVGPDGWTLMGVAAKTGDVEVVEILIQAGEKIDTAGKGYVPLYLAAEYGYIDVVKLLIQAQAGVNRSSTLFGVTPLDVAIEKGNSEIAEHLQRHGGVISRFNHLRNNTVFRHLFGNWNFQSDELLGSVGDEQVVDHRLNPPTEHELMTSLFDAIENNDLAKIRKYIGLGAKINEGVKYQKPMSLAVKKDYDGAVILLSQLKENIDRSYQHGASKSLKIKKQCSDAVMLLSQLKEKIDHSYRYRASIDLGIKKECADAVILLFKLEEKINNNYRYRKSIDMKIKKECADVVKLLSQLKEKINNNYRYGTPIDLAVDTGSTDAVALLYQLGADVNIQHMSCAVRNNDIPMIKRLNELGVPIKLRSGDDSLTTPSPIIIAAACGHVEAIKELVRLGADVNRMDSYGETAILEAIKHGKIEALKTLIDLKVKVDRFGSSRSPLYVAAVKNSLEAVKALVKAGADVNESSNSFFHPKPIDIAIENDHFKIATFLLDNRADVPKISPQHREKLLKHFERIGDTQHLEYINTQSVKPLSSTTNSAYQNSENDDSEQGPGVWGY